MGSAAYGLTDPASQIPRQGRHERALHRRPPDQWPHVSPDPCLRGARSRPAEAVDALLARVGLEDHEEQLRDENFWFDFATKIRLFEAAAEVLDDPDAALHIGAAALQLNVAPGMKLALRAFGTPRLVYANIVRASGKFTWAHTWDVLDKGPGEAQLRYTDVSGVGYHLADCQYNRGLLSCVPEMFGMAPAEIGHDHCAVDGADACVYDITWQSGAGWKVPVAVVGTTAAVTVLPAAVLAPALLPAAVAVPAAVASALSYVHHTKLRRRARSLKYQLDEQRETADRLSASLRDLVSELRIEEVLDKITANAKAAVGGKEFALLVRDESGRCHARSSGLPRDLLRGPRAVGPSARHACSARLSRSTSFRPSTASRSWRRTSACRSGRCALRRSSSRERVSARWSPSDTDRAPSCHTTP